MTRSHAESGPDPDKLRFARLLAAISRSGVADEGAGLDAVLREAGIDLEEFDDIICTAEEFCDEEEDPE